LSNLVDTVKCTVSMYFLPYSETHNNKPVLPVSIYLRKMNNDSLKQY